MYMKITFKFIFYLPSIVVWYIIIAQPNPKRLSLQLSSHQCIELQRRAKTCPFLTYKLNLEGEKRMRGEGKGGVRRSRGGEGGDEG